MAQSVTPESGWRAGAAQPVSDGERGGIELDEPVVAGLAWESHDGVLQVDLHGEICAWSVDRMQPILLGVLIDLRPRAIVVDMGGVTFLDASGVNLLIRARQLAASHGAPLLLAATSRAVLRVLTLCELDGDFGVS